MYDIVCNGSPGLTGYANSTPLSKLGRISNSTQNNSEFDQESRIRNSNSRSNLFSKIEFYQIRQSNLIICWSNISNLVKFYPYRGQKIKHINLFKPSHSKKLLKNYCIWPKIGLWMIEFGQIRPNKRSNFIEFRPKSRIRPNSTFDFELRNSKYRNSNEFEGIRPSLLKATSNIFC